MELVASDPIARMTAHDLPLSGPFELSKSGFARALEIGLRCCFCRSRSRKGEWRLFVGWTLAQ